MTCWHISNEYGGSCYCENCEKAFRIWLKEKYQTIEALNKAWNLEFWGHTVYSWEDVVLPNALASYRTDFYAFMPAVTRNKFQNGSTYYIGTDMDESGIARVLDLALCEAGVASVIPDETSLEVTCRHAADCDYYFIINFKDEVLPVPAFFAGKKEILTGNIVKADDMMSKYDVKIIQVKH